MDVHYIHLSKQIYTYIYIHTIFRVQGWEGYVHAPGLFFGFSRLRARKAKRAKRPNSGAPKTPKKRSDQVNGHQTGAIECRQMPRTVQFLELRTV